MSLHEQFDELGKPHATPPVSNIHPQSDTILRECKEILYNLPSGRPLINILNLHRIPVSVHIGVTAGYSLPHENTIMLTCPDQRKIPFYEMAIYLARALRHIELHIQKFKSPEMKDSREWSSVLVSEPFDLMLTVCRIIYDIKAVMQNEEVDAFIKAHDYEEIYTAFEKKLPFGEIEELMYQSIARKKLKADG